MEVDSEIESVREKDIAQLNQELGFASHLGIPAVMLSLKQACNINLAKLIYDKMLTGTVGMTYQVWVEIPMVHPSRFSPLYNPEEQDDSWEWWNDLRRYCHYDKRLGLVLELPDVKQVPSAAELDRWIGEPVKALVISTSLFVTNQHRHPVLPKVLQEIIQKFMSVDVQYIIKGATLDGHTYKHYCAYMEFLGKKLYKGDAVAEFVQGYV